MAKIFRILALLVAASMLLWIAGCGGDDDDDDCADNVAPTVTLNPAGGAIASNTVITAACTKAVDTVTVTGAAATPVADAAKKNWTFNLPEGSASITVEVVDACGDSASASGTYTVSAPDTTAPSLVGGDCDPKDGADGVDPADVSEIVLVFDEDLGSAEVTNFEPDGNVNPKVDGDTVTIEFLGNFSLGNEQEVVVEVTVVDLAGNSADIEYGFTTMAKE